MVVRRRELGSSLWSKIGQLSSLCFCQFKFNVIKCICLDDKDTSRLEFNLLGYAYSNSQVKLAEQRN